MKFNYKVTVLFLFLALIPLFLFSIISIENTKNALLQQTTASLGALANIQVNRVHSAVDQYVEIAQSISSRRQLRVSLREYNRTGDLANVSRIQNIIDDAVNAIYLVEAVHVYNSTGTLIVSSDGSTSPSGLSDEMRESLPIRTSFFEDFVIDDSGVPQARLFSSLVLDDVYEGFVEIYAKSDLIFSITRDYNGLGDTGEILIAQKNQSGDAVFITPLRFDASASLRRALPRENERTPVIAVVNGVEGFFTRSDSVDYRGETVFAAARYIDVLDWGLVVKIDRSEIFEPIDLMKKIFWILFLITVTSIFIVGFLVSASISDPIVMLTRLVDSFRKGDLSMRSDLHSRDEIGDLAESFNQMAQEIQEAYATLEDRVKERTKEVEEKTLQVQEKLEETKRLNKLMVNREIKMIEMKKEIELFKDKKV